MPWLLSIHPTTCANIPAFHPSHTFHYFPHTFRLPLIKIFILPFKNHCVWLSFFSSNSVITSFSRPLFSVSQFSHTLQFHFIKTFLLSFKNHCICFFSFFPNYISFSQPLFYISVFPYTPVSLYQIYPYHLNFSWFNFHSLPFSSLTPFKNHCICFFFLSKFHNKFPSSTIHYLNFPIHSSFPLSNFPHHLNPSCIKFSSLPFSSLTPYYTN